MKKKFVKLIFALLLTIAFSTLSNQAFAQCSPLPDPSFTGLTTPVCESAAIVTLTPTLYGGVFSGPGITGNSFNPSLAGAGTHIVTYTISPTSSYVVSAITFAPLSTAGTAVTLLDDQTTGLLPIGFNFSFYGNTYSQFIISSNGFISFDPTASQGCCQGQLLPDPISPNNLIAAIWNDIYPPGGGSITYQTTGTAPNRKLVVSFTAIPHCCTTSPPLNTGQIILYETTNIIEIHNTLVTDDGSVHTEGIENATGTVAVAVAGRNATNWTSTNDAWRFSPNACGNSSTQTVTVNPSAPVTVNGAGTFCGSTIITATGGSGGIIYFQGTNSTGTSIANPSTSEIVTGSGTYYFRQLSPLGCWSNSLGASVTIKPLPPTPVISPAGNIEYCQGSPTTTTLSIPPVSFSTPALFNIALANLVNLPNDCGTGGRHGNNIGISWTDAGLGIVTNVQVELSIGVDCSGGAHTTTFNGVAATGFTTTTSCTCTPRSTAEIITLNFTPTIYNLGGTNTFLFSGNTFGLVPDASLGNNYARVTVTYGAPPIAWTPGGQTTNSITVSPASSTTYTVQVTGGNSCSSWSSKTISVNVCNVPPVAVCQNVSVNANANCQATVTAAQVNNGSSDADGDALTYSLSPAGPYPLGTTNVTLTVTDIFGNTSTCTSNVIVRDVTPPNAICQNVTVNLSPSGSGSTTAAQVNNGSTDACGIATLSVNNGSFSCANVGTTFIVLTATDIAGNTSTCSSNVTVRDVTPPVAICQSVTVDLNGSGNGSVTAAQVNNGSSDACGIGSLTLNTSSFTCANIGSNTAVLTATDNSGNTATCSSTVTVRDVTAPTAVCRSVTVDLDGSGNGSISVAQVNNGSSDACGIATLSINASSYNCSHVGNHTVVLTATDVNGNTSTCSSNVLVQDATPPDITVPSNITVNNTPGTCGAAVTYTTPTATDNCASVVVGNQTLNYTGAVQPWTVPAGVTLINIQAWGAMGGTNTNDGNGFCGQIGGLGGYATGDLIVVPGEVVNIYVGGRGQPGSVGGFNGGGLGCSNTSTCATGGGSSDVRQGGNVLNNRKIVAAGGGGAEWSGCNGTGGHGGGLTGINGNEGGAAAKNGLGATQLAGGVGGVGGHSGTAGSFGFGGASGNHPAGHAGGGGGGWYGGGGSAEDGHGGGGSSYIGGVVNGSTSAGLRSGDGLVTITWSANTNPSVTQTTGLASGTTFPVGTTTNTFTATDAAGNTATSSFTVTVIDNQAPTINFPGNFFGVAAPGTCGGVVNYSPPVGNDNCPGAVTTQIAGLPSGSVFPVGSTTNTYQVTDAAGLTATTSFVVVVTDQEAPVITCPSNITVDNTPGDCVGAATFAATATDNCGVQYISYLPSGSGSNFLVGTTTVTAMAVDLSSSNSATCTFTVTVVDIEPPVAACRGFLPLQLDANHEVTVTAAQLDFGSYDICGIGSLSILGGNPVFTCAELNVPITLTLVVTDVNGLTSTCNAQVMVFDNNNPCNQDPIAICQNVTVNTDGNCVGNVTGADVNNGSSDPDGDALTYSLNPAGPYPLGTTPVTLTVTDPYGASSSCNATITVYDGVSPTISCPANITANATSGAGAVVNYVVTGTDNCAGATTVLTAGPASGSTFPLGVTTVTHTVTDAAGLTAECTFSVTVVIPPISIAGVVTNTICTGTSNGWIDVSITGGLAPYTYLWNNGASSEDRTGLAPGVYTVTVSDNFTNVATASFTVGTTIPALKPATPGAISGPNPICIGTTNTYFIAPVLNAGYYTWTVPASAVIISGQGTTAVTVQFTGNVSGFNISVTASNCKGTSAARTITVSRRAIPYAPAAVFGTSPVCFGSTHTYTIAPVANATHYTWIPPANTTITSGQGTTSITLEIGAGYTNSYMFVTASNCSGTSGTRPFTLLSFSPPGTPGVISGPTVVCPENTVTYSIAAVSYATSYTWTAPANASVISGQGTTTATITYHGGFTTGNVAVTASNCNGTSITPRLLAITITPSVPIISGSVDGVCGNTSQTYSVAAVNGATDYEWSVIGASSFSGQGTQGITVDFPAAYSTVTIKVRAITPCSVSAWSSISTIRSVPRNPLAISGLTPVCAGSTQTYSIASVTGATGYLWTLPAGDWTYVSGQGTTSYTVIAGTSAIALKVQASNSCGLSGFVTKSIAITTSGCGVAGKTDETEGEPSAEQHLQEFHVKAYPNPFSNQFRLEVSGSGDENLEIRMFDLLGQLIQNNTNVAYQSDITYGSTLARGVYLLEVTQGDKTKVLRIVKSE